MSNIRTQIDGHTGRIILDRPKALNALTQSMCEDMTKALLLWKDDPAIHHVLVEGEGDRAFCAGGDVVLLHDSGKAGDSRAEDFWTTEYKLNVLIHEYPKPYIALIDGIVMGGGVGLSVHGDTRVAGDTTLFAMPETGIGYFPDVGGTYFLPRLGEAVGKWLGLTGARLGPADCFHLGIATHVVPTARHEEMKLALAQSEDVESTLADFHVGPDGKFELPNGIDAFLEADVPAILAALDANGSEWAQAQAESLRKKSPLALAVTLEALRRGRNSEGLREAIDRELDVSVNFLKTQDFYEGIRAQLIDKDRNPSWSHDFGEVTEDQIERLFRPSTAPLNFHTL